MTNPGPPGPPIDPRLQRPAPAVPAAAAPPSPAPAVPSPPPAQPPAPLGEPPAFGELIAAGALALASPGDTFAGLARREEPTPADAALAFLAWGGAAAAFFVGFAVTKLNAEAWGVLPLAAGAMAFLILSAPLGLAAAGLLHALAAVSGGQGGYWRSVEAAAGLGAVPALALAALWFAPDPGWVAAPLLVGTWLAVNAVEKLHDAPGAQAWMVVGVAGALLAGSAAVGREKVALGLVRLENAATVMGNNPAAHQEPKHSSAGLAAPTAGGMGMPSDGDRMTGQAGAAGPIETDSEAAVKTGQSSLDFLRTDADGAGGPAPSEAAMADDARMAQARAMQDNAAGLVQRLSQQLEKNSAALPPDQAANLKKMLAQFQRSIQGGGGKPMMTPEETQRMLQQFLGAAAQVQAQKTGTTYQPPKKGRPAPPPPADD